jgi:hypothetical protein
MRRLCHRVYQGEKALGSLVGFALSDLVGLDCDQGVMTAFGLNGHSNAADGTGELPAPGLLLHRSQGLAEKPSGSNEHFGGWEVGSVEVFHAITSASLVLEVRVGDLRLSHQMPERVLELGLLNEEIVLWV